MNHAIEWKQHKLVIADQSKLLNKQTKVQIRNPKQAVEAIAAKKITNGTALGILGAFALYLGIKTPPMAKTYEKLMQQIDKQFAFLCKAAPSSMNLAWALERMRRCAANNRDHKLSTLRDILLREAMNILKEEGETCRTLTVKGAELIRDGDTVLTMGNTGAYSSAGNGSALGIIIQAASQHADVQVLLCESRPRLYGAHQAALELKQAKVPFRLISDNMAGHLMKKGMVDVVLVGAERVAMNADVVGDIGTYGLSLLAYHHRVSFYVAAAVSAFDRNLVSGELIPDELWNPEEVLKIDGKTISINGAKGYYPAFDVTPHKHLSALITELGVIRAPYDQNLRNLFSNLV